MGYVSALGPSGLVEAALATARLTRLVIHDEVTAPIREPVKAWASRRRPTPAGSPPESSIELLKRPVAHPKIAYVLECPWCVSTYVAPIVWVLGRHRYGRVVVAVLAMSEATGIIETVLVRLETP